MAKLNASKFTNRDILVTGTDPSTGEYLSAAQRKALFKKKKISSNQVFRKPGAIVKSSPGMFRKRGALVKTETSAITPDIDINVVQSRVFVLENQVSFLAKALDKETEQEKKAQKDREKEVLQEEESALRSGKEKQLESGLFKALISPVNAVGGVAKGMLQRLMEFFGLLLAGWLTDKGWKALEAYMDGDSQKLKSIGIEVGKALGAALLTFSVLNGGILSIIGIVGAITGAILTAPFKALWKAFRDGGGKPEQTPTKPKPNQGGGLFGALRQFGRKLGIGANTYTSPIGPQPLDSGTKGLGGWAKSGAGETGDVFGNVPRLESQAKKSLAQRIKEGIFKRIGLGPESPAGKIISKLKEVFPENKAAKVAADAATKPKSIFSKMLGGLGGLGKKILPLLNAAFFVGSVRDRAIQGMSPAQAILGAMFPLAGSITGAGFGGLLGGGLLSALTAFAGSLAGDFIGSQVQRLLDFVWRPGWDEAPGIKNFNDMIYSLQSEGALGNILQSAFPYTKTKGSTQKLGSEESSPEATPSSAGTPSPAADAASVPSIASPESPQMQAPGPISSAGNTTVIYKKIGGGGQQLQQSMKNGSATDVPLIASANPDNFYTMYSQLIYNVVI